MMNSGALSQEQLARVNRLATEARFVAGLAHELNNSLQVVSGLVELLVERPDLPSDVQLRLQKIGAQTEKASAAIRHVLGFTRDQQAGGPVADLAAGLRHALALRRYALERATIAVTLDAPSAPTPVRADPHRLLQLIVNLILNAEEALADQPIRTLRLAVERDADRVRLVVADSGPGVAADLRERVFEPFVTTRRSRPRALGLGLSVGRATAAASGGTLQLEGGDQTGATFVLDLPAA